MNIKELLLSKNILFLGFASRVLILFFLLIFPLYHIDFGYIGPLTYYKDIADIEWFERFFLIYKYDINNNLNFFIAYKNQINDFIIGVYNSKQESTPLIFPGPIFPIILKLTFYSQKNTIYLFLLIFISEFVAFCLWQIYFNKQKLNIIFKLFYCIFPMPLIFAFIHTSDTIFFIFLSYFLILILDKYNSKNNFLIILMFLLSIMTRPSGIICSVFVVYLLFRKVIKFNKLQLILFSSITLLSIIYYTPYFFYELNKQLIADVNSNQLFIISNSITNVSFINNFIFYFFKFLYIFGFQESSSQNLLIQATKTSFATYFVIGFINLNLISKNHLKFFVNIYLFSIVFFLSPQWRYILPISPILFYYSSIFFHFIFIKASKYLE